MFGIIKKKEQGAPSTPSKKEQTARSRPPQKGPKAAKPPKPNSGWKEITATPKDPAPIHKETSSGWDLITKKWKKATPSETEKKPQKLPETKKPAPTPPPKAKTPPPTSPSKSASTPKPPKTTAGQPVSIGRPKPAAKPSAPSRPAERPAKPSPVHKQSPKQQPHPTSSSAKSKKQSKPRSRGIDEMSQEWEEIASGWGGQAPEGWNVTPPHPDDSGEKIKLRFRKNVHTLSTILKEMADELFVALRERDDQILFVRTELQKYKDKAHQLEKTVQQQWDAEVLRVRDKEIAKARNEMKIYKAKAERLEKTLSIQDEFTYERLLEKYNNLVRDILVKRTWNNEQKMRNLSLIAHHLGIPQDEAVRIIRDKINKIMAQVNRL